MVKSRILQFWMEFQMKFFPKTSMLIMQVYAYKVSRVRMAVAKLLPVVLYGYS